MKLALITCALVSASAAQAVNHTVPQYDPAKGAHDGLQLVGMECQHKKGTLEVDLFQARLPDRPFDLWRTADLVVANQNWDVEQTLSVEKRCTLGKDRFVVRLTGAPQAANLQWQCGAVIAARTVVLRNGRQVFEGQLGGCNAPYLSGITLREGSDAVETTTVAAPRQAE